MGPQLEALAKESDRLKLRKVDVVSWDSPVAQRYRIRSLPTLWLYIDGERVETDARAALERLREM